MSLSDDILVEMCKQGDLAAAPDRQNSLAGSVQDKADEAVSKQKSEQKIALVDGKSSQEKALTGAPGNSPEAGGGHDDVKYLNPNVPRYSVAAGAERTQASRSEGLKSENDAGGKVVSEGAVKINVSDVAAVEAQVNKIAADLGGWVENDVGSLRIFVPGGEFDRAVAALGQLGKVVDKQVNTRDISGEYNDLKARIGGLEIQEKQLTELVRQTVSPTEKVSAEKDLRGAQEELALLRGQLTQLDSAVNTAVITLELNRQG